MSNAIVRSLDTNVGPRFLSISNASLLDAVRNAANVFGIDDNAVRVIGNERRMTAMAKLRDMAFEVPGDGTLIPQLFFRNWNTGGKALTIGVGLFRLVCSNGLTVGVPGMSFEYKIRHVDGPKAHGLLDTLPHAIDEAIQFIAQGGLLNQIEEAKDTQVRNAIEVVASLPIGSRAKETAITRIAFGSVRKEDDTTTAWGLYNHVNECIRSRSRSEFTALNKDEGLLSDIMLLSA